MVFQDKYFMISNLREVLFVMLILCRKTTIFYKENICFVGFVK